MASGKGGHAIPELPTGTVTFLFSDIEGSTRLLQRLGDDYARVLGEHQALLRAAWAAHGGVEIDTAGDGFFVAFPSAPGAVAAAADATRALAGHPGRRVSPSACASACRTGRARGVSNRRLRTHRRAGYTYKARCLCAILLMAGRSRLRIGRRAARMVIAARR